MMSELPVRSMKIIKNIVADTTMTTETQYLPIINSNSLPPNTLPGVGSAIAYDKTTKRVYYNNGIIWVPLAVSSSSTGASYSYSFIKNGSKVIAPGVITIVADWTILPTPPYHDNTSDWNLISGIYTASVDQTVSFNLDIAWEGGISNLGFRTVQVIYKPSAGVPMIAKSSSTQADPATNVDTTQETSTILKMFAGDQAWIEVVHSAPVNLTLSSGITNSISGIKIVT
jgi:hypothetical protein